MGRLMDEPKGRASKVGLWIGLKGKLMDGLAGGPESLQAGPDQA